MQKQKKSRFQTLKAQSSTSISPQNAKSIGSARIDSPEDINIASLNLQIPLHKTPSPKSITSPLKEKMLRIFKTYTSQPIKQTSKKAAARGPSTKKLEIKYSGLQLELKQLQFQNKELKRSDELKAKLEQCLRKVLAENESIKQRMHCRQEVKLNSGLEEAMNDIKQKVSSLLNQMKEL